MEEIIIEEAFSIGPYAFSDIEHLKSKFYPGKTVLGERLKILKEKWQM